MTNVPVVDHFRPGRQNSLPTKWVWSLDNEGQKNCFKNVAYNRRGGVDVLVFAIDKLIEIVVGIVDNV